MTRKRKKKTVRKSVVIFCEGKSEESYFNMLRTKYRRSMVQAKKIVVKDKGVSGRKLINFATDFMQYHHNKFDQAYVAFDRDERDDIEIDEYLKLAECHNIKIIFSSASFEVWILLHFKFFTKQYNPQQLCQLLSGKEYFNRDYNRFKGGDYTPFLRTRVETAHVNANRLFVTNRHMISDNPFTNMHLMIKEIFEVDQF